MVGLAGRAVVFERMSYAHGLLTASPHVALLAEQRWRLERGIGDSTTDAAIAYSHADAHTAVPGLHGHYVRRTAHAGRHHRLTTAGFFVPFSVEKKDKRKFNKTITQLFYILL